MIFEDPTYFIQDKVILEQLEIFKDEGEDFMISK